MKEIDDKILKTHTFHLSSIFSQSELFENKDYYNGRNNFLKGIYQENYN